MNLDEIGAASASREYVGLIDPLTDAIILAGALLTILLTWRAWNRRTPIGAFSNTPLHGISADTGHDRGNPVLNRGPVRFRKIRRVEDAVKWARAMLWRAFLLAFFVGAILTAGTSGSLLAWWYLGGP
ncbi:MAG: hypothetical protein F4Z81_03260 [Gemmatimonadetes bacterium]|nr:hypothetical protein [Gemmatimonadota bacterium]MYB61942.1 hypothetical protein [Gemmatimonadota bacterium]